MSGEQTGGTVNLDVEVLQQWYDILAAADVDDDAVHDVVLVDLLGLIERAQSGRTGKDA